ncbi:sorbosone dehydrogenase [Pseudomonas sp. Pc102]|uniref:PQQ-dependent sugar dehydrogenase n=1 Tax=Pseudomonas sp. Pc102 TaxID=2678261 RepID=UPI001BCCD68A|nr:sorbosone dehydrogenase family protein [Pseudomonas sp. Pc102]BBP84376.1 sorbosone dehydrogenase [Pseudomonas sp. Pc102]
MGEPNPLNVVFSLAAGLFLVIVLAGFARADDALPPPDPTHKVKNYSKVQGWADGQTPVAPRGFRVNRYAGELNNPRWLYVTPNGDVLVAEANPELKDDKAREKARRDGKLQSQNYGRSADRITLLRDTDGDGVAEQRVTFLDGLRQPLGMQVVGDWFYVANTDALWRYPYQPGDLKIHGEGEKILDLPAGGYNNHWTRNILANADNSKLYISVGSASNLGDHGMQEEERRANILEINPDGSGERIFASGLRNPVGMGWAPGTQDLWTVVNERDNLGEDLVPDYLAKVEAGAFYGWPYAYFGPHEDPRLAGKRPDLVARARKPDLSLGAHTASLGLAFYTQQAFPERYRDGAFVGQHGSWNRSALSGYKVVFVPFENGEPSGAPEDFLTGFVKDADKAEVFGRPAGIAVLPSGALLVADDAGNSLWQVRVEP